MIMPGNDSLKRKGKVDISYYRAEAHNVHHFPFLFDESSLDSFFLNELSFRDNKCSFKER